MYVKLCKMIKKKCWTQIIRESISFYSIYLAGHNGINLIPVDPLHIPSISIKQGDDSPVNIELAFKDVDLVGLSNCHFEKIS